MSSNPPVNPASKPTPLSDTFYATFPCNHQVAICTDRRESEEQQQDRAFHAHSIVYPDCNLTPPRFTADELKLIDDYHRLYYGKYWRVADGVSVHQPITDVRWLGHQCMKPPSDMMMYQEVIWDTRPDLIIECGTANGGSALFYASVCELLRHGEVITIDVAKYPRALHSGITWVIGDTLSEEVLDPLRQAVRQYERVMVILDDAHDYRHVLGELDVYSKFVTLGCYLVVEDTNINGHPVFPDFGPGPWEAVHEWIPKQDDFIIDKSRERFSLTYAPDGWLKRVR